MAKWFEFLKKSYPFNDDLKQNTKLIFIISTFFSSPLILKL